MKCMIITEIEGPTSPDIGLTPNHRSRRHQMTKLITTIQAVATVLVLAASPALAIEESAASSFAIPDRHMSATSTYSAQSTQAYASTKQNHVVRNRAQNARPSTQAEQFWFMTAQGYEDRF
jgi:hypothetical protein